jgi:hypothetical protein
VASWIRKFRKICLIFLHYFNSECIILLSESHKINILRRSAHCASAFATDSYPFWGRRRRKSAAFLPWVPGFFWDLLLRLFLLESTCTSRKKQMGKLLMGEVANQKRRGCTDVSAGVLWHDGVDLAAVSRSGYFKLMVASSSAHIQ